MSVTQVKQAIGSWNVRLRGNIPKAVLDAIKPFGHVAVIPGSVNVQEYKDNLLSAARYVGVYRTKATGDDTIVLSGVGLESWLGDENGSGSVFESSLSLTGASFAASMTAALPPSGSITAGTFYSVAGTYTGQHQWVNSRKVLDYITSLFGAEWRVNNTGTLDAGLVSDLYVTNPRAILVAKNDSSDLRYRALPGQASMETDSADYTTRVVVLGEGEGDTIQVGSADAVSVPYNDLHGNPVQVTRVISESYTSPTNVDARAALFLAQYGVSSPSVSLSTDAYDIKGDVVVGDYIYVYNPEVGFFDNANEVLWNGEIINPIKLRVVELSWPIRRGWTVAYRDGSGVWTDLSRYVFFEGGSTNVIVGDLPRELTGGGITEPIGSRPSTDTTVPGVPAFGTFTVGSYQSAGTSDIKSAIQAQWTTPLNTDSSVILDGAYYEIRYRVSEVIGYKIKWGDISGIYKWGALAGNAWSGILSNPVSASQQWIYQQVGWGINQTQILELTPSVEYEFQIRAVDSANPPHFGAWSASSYVTTVGDLFAPSTPAAPVVAGNMSAIQVTHSLGKNSGGTYNLEPDTVRLTVHVGGSASFMPDRYNQVGELAANIGMMQANISAVGTFPIPQIETVYVKVVAIDRAGNKSSPSPGATVAAELIDDLHISSLSVSKLTAGTITATSVLAATMSVSGTGGFVLSGGGDLQVLDGGNIVIREGSVDVQNNTGDTQIEMGLLSDGTYGLAAVDATGILVPLSRLAFGAKTDSMDFTDMTTDTSNWVDLTAYGPGPTVTGVEVGDSGRMIVIVSCRISIGGSSTIWGSGGFMSFEIVDQATSTQVLSPSQGRSASSWKLNIGSTYQEETTISKTFLVTGLAAGIYTIRAKYQSFGPSSPGTEHCDFSNRNILVLPY